VSGDGLTLLSSNSAAILGGRSTLDDLATIPASAIVNLEFSSFFLLVPEDAV
jgi:hypothetical protein